MPLRKGNQLGTLGRTVLVLPFVGFFAATFTAVGRQPPTASPDLVDSVRASMASGGLVAAEQTLNKYRAHHGSALEIVDALLWLGRGALAAKLYDKATGYAREGHELALTTLVPGGSSNERAHTSIAMAVELRATVMAEQGARSDAVHLLRRELEIYHDTAAAETIKTTLRLVSLEGQRAPAFEPGMTLGSRLSDVTAEAAQPTLVFFWAHWCRECKAESPMLAKLVSKYHARGLTIVAPTRRYGYVESGRPAAPDKELRHIVRVRDAFYGFLKRAAVPVSDANYRTYGVSIIPAYVLTDRHGLIRLYHAGRITEPELDAAIADVLER